MGVEGMAGGDEHVAVGACSAGPDSARAPADDTSDVPQERITPSEAPGPPRPRRQGRPRPSELVTLAGPRLAETCFGKHATQRGTPANDRIEARRPHRRDVIVALGGDDMISGIRDGDLVCGGRGDDRVHQAAAGRSRPGYSVDLGNGDDRFTVDRRDYVDVRAGSGDDRLTIHGASYSVEPGPGDDVATVPMPREGARAANTPCVDFRSARRPVRVNLAAEQATGQGHDTLVNVRCVRLPRFGDVALRSALADYFDGRRGGDLIRTGAGNDGVSGGAQADRIYLGPGNDSGRGGQGRDRLYGQAGHDTIEGWTEGDYLDGGAGNDQIFGGLYCELSGHSYGTGGVISSNGGNEMFGGPGQDYLTGDLGSDRIDGGPGLDRGQGGYRDGRVDWIPGDDDLRGDHRQSSNMRSGGRPRIAR